MAAASDPDTVNPDSRLVAAEALAAAIPALVSQPDMIGLALGVVVDDQVVVKQTGGVVRLGEDSAVTPDTVFRIASLSKGFAATLSALLVEQGTLRWDESVSEAVPAFKLTETLESKITVETLLGQSTGLPHFAYDNLLEAQINVERILSRLEEVDLMCPVGSCYSYQNVAFSAIAPMIEAKTGRPWDAVMNDTLFEPLGMVHASHGREGLVEAKKWAQPHVRTRRGWTPVRVKETYYRVAPAGGINASLEDMLIWLKAQMGLHTDVIDPVVLSRLHSPRVKSTRELYAPSWRRHRINQAHYGLGWRIFDYRGKRLVFHAGGVAGYRAQIAFMPELKLGFVALWNSSSGRGWGLLPTLYDKALAIRSLDWMDLPAGSASAAAQ